MAYGRFAASTVVFAVLASSLSIVSVLSACGGPGGSSSPCKIDDDCQLGGVPGVCVDGQCGPAGDGSDSEPTSESSSDEAEESSGDSVGEESGESEGSETESGETETEGGDVAPSLDMDVEVDRVEEGVVVLYRLDEGSGTTVHDTAPVDPPIDLQIIGGGYEWRDDGLFFQGDATTIAAAPLETSHSKLTNACTDSDEITIEAWFTPNELLAVGPTRIVTFSVNTSFRNFLLGQGTNANFVEEGFSARLRTESTDFNGLPALELPTQVHVQTPTHLLFVHHADGSEALFLDGQIEAEGMRLGEFDFAGPDLRLALGNEHEEDRAFAGEIHLIAVYCRGLDDAEAVQNYNAGF